MKEANLSVRLFFWSVLSSQSFRRLVYQLQNDCTH